MALLDHLPVRPGFVTGHWPEKAAAVSRSGFLH